MEEIKTPEQEGEKMEPDFEKIAKEKMAEFKDAMDNRNLEKMLSFFAKKFTFLPTKWNKIVTQLEGMEEGVYSAEKYFTEFFESSPVITVKDFYVTPHNSSLFSITALDDFELSDENGQRQIATCKFDQRWTFEDKQWKMEHFLSAIAIDKH